MLGIVAVLYFVLVMVVVISAKTMANTGKMFGKIKEASAILSDEICGSSSFSNITGIVSAPKLPFRYSKRVNCQYTIENGQMNSFVLSIDRTGFGNTGNCNSGWLTVSSQAGCSTGYHRIALY